MDYPLASTHVPLDSKYGLYLLMKSSKRQQVSTHASRQVLWCSLQVQDRRNADNKVEKCIGAPPMANPQTYFDASPISYATYANNGIGVLLATGTNDDLVDPKSQTEPFQLALKQAGFFVRPCIVPGAPHYWMNDPIEEPASLSGFLAPRLVRFLVEKL